MSKHAKTITLTLADLKRMMENSVEPTAVVDFGEPAEPSESGQQKQKSSRRNSNRPAELRQKGRKLIGPGGGKKDRP